jgi:hypothetical protein
VIIALIDVFDSAGAVARLESSYHNDLGSRCGCCPGEYIGLPPRNAAECAGPFEHAELTVQPGRGALPWLHGPVWFTRTLAAVLG